MNAMSPVEQAPRMPVVLWVYQDIDGLWRFRREGDLADCAYASRRDAMTAARMCGELAGSYWLNLQRLDGRFMLELLNTRAEPAHSLRLADRG